MTILKISVLAKSVLAKFFMQDFSSDLVNKLFDHKRLPAIGNFCETEFQSLRKDFSCETDFQSLRRIFQLQVAFCGQTA